MVEEGWEKKGEGEWSGEKEKGRRRLEENHGAEKSIWMETTAVNGMPVIYDCAII